MRVSRDLLAALSDGPVGPDDLAARLGWDRERVREGIDDLRAAGFGIDRVDRGYRVTAIPGYGAGVAWELDASFSVEYHPTIPSTNDRAREIAADEATEVAVFADEQTGGRGRHEREWASPPGGVWASLALRPAIEPGRVQLLGLGAAVAVVRAARGVGVEAGIKWPNDVLAGGKLAGVLVESATAGDGVAWAVVGIGVNANVDPDALPAGATSLREHAGGIDRVGFTRHLLEAFDTLRREPDAITDAWRAHARTLGRRVRVETPEGTVVGEAVDVDDAGALLVDEGGTRVRVGVGECEHLRPS